MRKSIFSMERMAAGDAPLQIRTLGARRHSSPVRSTTLLKSLRLIILTTLLASSSAVPIHAQDTAPLYLSIIGSGSVSPLTNGQSLAVGQRYNMVASPGAGFAFSSWQPVNVFTTTTFVVDTNGNTTNTVVSVLGSPIPTFTNQPSLAFVMQPVVLIYDNPVS